MALKPLNLLQQVADNFSFRVDPAKSEHENAEEVTRNAALLSAAIAAEPIPWLDLLVILPLQVKLVIHIGRIYGFNLSRERAKRVLAEIGGAVAFGWASRQVIRGLSKIALPVIGGLLTAPVAYGGTFALGHLAERYFRAQRGDLPPLGEQERRELTKTLTAQGRVVGESVTAQDLKEIREGLKQRVARRRSGDES
jgi:uncharacterized protein (DUF697 family)